MSAALEARGLVRRFGDLTAVQNVSLELHAGEVVGLLGPNGAGKTTILRMLAGILAPNEGTVEVMGVDTQVDPLAARRQIGFLSGDTQLYQRLNSREVLDYFGRLYGVPPALRRQRIEQLVRELDMASFADRPCGQLSSGQKQRANIARAFLHEPSVLILDEPTNALDVLTGRFIIQAIRREKAAGRAILFSTHIMGEAEYLCDRILLLHKGEIVGGGTVAGILEQTGCANLTDAFLKCIGETEALA
jgi:sodium transport system ATP-binding protein